MPNGNRGRVGFIRPAASPEQLARYAKVVGQWLAVLDGEAGCAVCGCGAHVEHCPVPALRRAKADLDFMAAVPVAHEAPVRGVAS